MAQNVLTAHVNERGFQGPRTRFRWARVQALVRAVATSEFLVPLVIAFGAYYIAGKLGQATTNIRSSNLGPVWPAFGIALAVVLGYGVRVWPAIAASAFVVALQSPVPGLTAAGQAAGATLAVVIGATVLRGTARFRSRAGAPSGGVGLHCRRLRWRVDQCVDRRVFALCNRAAGIHWHWLGLADLLAWRRDRRAARHAARVHSPYAMATADESPGR